MTIRDRIVARRRARVAREGPALGAAVPAERQAPAVPFAAGPLVICEIKKRSPSRGAIDAGLDVVRQAGRYAAAGIRHVSVLTEPDHFGGSLDDLTRIKRRFPDLAVLRKDFLLDERDVEVSHRAGADAVLLIAGMIDADRLASMLRAAERLGMAALVEVHDPADVDRMRAVRPPLVGINARDLTTFGTDLAHPLRLRPLIDWPARLVFESGIFFAEQASLARAAGFAGVLVGEGVVRRPELAGELAAAFRGAAPPDFWGRLYARSPLRAGCRVTTSESGRLYARSPLREPAPRPLVKVCGVTCRDDALCAAEAGADLIGFILADSPRRAAPDMIARLGDVGALKVGVAVDDASTAAALRADGHLDAVQLHGAEPAARCADLAQPYFKAVRVRDRADLDRIDAYRCPRVLIDAPAAGRRVGAELVDGAAARRPLWLAGGLNPGNVSAVIDRHAPELIDASSGLESAPGRKDPERLRAFFAAIRAARTVRAARRGGASRARRQPSAAEPFAMGSPV